MIRIAERISSGRIAKADIEIKLFPQEDKIKVTLHSSVEKLFGNHVRSYIKRYLSSLSVSSCKVDAIDDGALDFVIKSRIESILYKGDSSSVGGFRFKKREGSRKQNDLRRTRLYIPGNNPYLMEGCGLFGADVIILDLEDAVSQNEKTDARFLVRNALGNLDFGDAEVIVRINPFSNEGEEDLRIILPALPDAIMLPKTNGAKEIERLDALIGLFEKANSVLGGQIKIFPLIETAEGVLNAREIAEASKRNVMLTFGAEDFTADIGVKKSKEGVELLFAKEQIVLAGKAANIQVSDSVYSDFEDIEGLIGDTKSSKAIGFDGRGVIHPLQIEHIHNVYEPTEEEIEYAKKVVEALEEAEKRGSGVASVGSKMIDAPVAKRARRVLELAKKYKRREKREE